MGKLERKRERLVERIKHLEDELSQFLTKKTSNVREINVGEQQRKISDLNNELKNLK